MKRISLIALALATVAFGCRSESTGKLAFVPTESSVLDASQATPLDLEDAQVLDVAHLVRIDGNAADLAPITWVGGTESGISALILLQDRQVRLYGADAQHVSTFGREGEGPGEFRYPIRGGWREDTLWVADGTLRRVTLVDTTGRLVRMIPPLTSVSWPARSDHADRYVGPTVYGLSSGDSAIILGIPTGRSNFHLLLATFDGEVQDLIMDLGPTSEGRITYKSSSAPNAGGSIAVPFATHILWQVAPDASAIARVEPDETAPGEFIVTVVSPHGDTVYSRRYAIAPVSIPKQEIDHAMQAALTSAKTPELRRLIQFDLREHVPETYPPYHGLKLDDAGCVWLGLLTPEKRTRWARLDPAGDLDGTAYLPNSALIAQARATHLWVVETDSDDVESVVQYRVRPCPS